MSEESKTYGRPMTSEEIESTSGISRIGHIVDTHTLAIAGILERLDMAERRLNIATKLRAESESSLEQLRKQVVDSAKMVERAMAIVESTDLELKHWKEKPVTMPDPLPGQTMSDEQVWLEAWCAATDIEEPNCVPYPTKWADACLSDFKQRFRK